MFPNDAVYEKLDSPVGELTLVASSDGLHAIQWSLEHDLDRDRKHPVLRDARAQLEEYFDRKRTSFDLPLAPTGTPFQLRAWRALSRIPFGKTISYQEQARQLGDRKKARAVGMANGRNPIAIVVPCHRVIGKNGSLTGFGGGLDVKKFLLELECA